MINTLDKWSFNKFRVAKAPKRQTKDTDIKLGKIRRRLEELKEERELESLYSL